MITKDTTVHVAMLYQNDGCASSQLKGNTCKIPGSTHSFSQRGSRHYTDSAVITLFIHPDTSLFGNTGSIF